MRKRLGGTDTTTYTHNAADRLTTLTPPLGSAITFSYDANGNMTGDSTGRTLTWNALDQLTALNKTGMSATFAYDPLGRRVSFVKNGQTKTYLYDGLDMLKDGASTFLNGVGMDEPLTITNGSTTQTYLGDHLGSVDWLASSTGAFQTRYDYTSYGKLEGGLPTPSTVNSLSYTAREDDGAGLMFFRARYYDPSLERFISDDPLGDAQRYVGGNPVSWMDPLGLRPGDDYPSPNAAGIGAVRDINPKSIKQNREYAGSICKKYFGFGPYTYTCPNKGTIDSSMPSACSFFDNTVGGYHTHGAYDPNYDSENFSPQDKYVSERTKKPEYLGTPSGKIKKYTRIPGKAGKGRTSVLGKGAK